MDEVVYEEGRRSAWRRILAECLVQLDYPEGEKRIAQLVKEREEAIAILRDLCRDFGDNDWIEDLNLADIIEKHLGKYLFTDKDNSNGRKILFCAAMALL